MNENFEERFSQYNKYERPLLFPNYGESVAKGVELHNYTSRQISEDGTYAIVTTHTERVEDIPQPPTPEEIAAQKRSERIASAIVGSVVIGFVAIFGWVAYKEEKNYQRNTELDSSSGS